MVDGPSFYQKFCTPPTGSIQAADVVTPGYPPPIESTGDSIVSGYYLDGEGFEDVAVISVLAFESDSPVEFQTVAQKIFADAVRDGKTKLVIDLSSNGGGYILQGYDLFRQLFPDIIQDGFSRLRESDSFLAVTKVFSDFIPDDYDPNTATEDQISVYETFMNYRYDYNLTNQPFESFAAKFGPHPLRGDEFTSLLRWNLDDPLTTSNETFGLGTDITGYGSRKNFTQPFKAENIIMLMDTYCASTCTLFAEFMRIQAGVKTIAMGGRPKAGPIQGVGGIKGAQILSWSAINSWAQFALQIGTATPEEKIALESLTTLPISRSTSSGINIRDNILRDNVNDGLPAQFAYEAADCRLYYTLPMITDVTALWKSATSAAFNGGKCASGGLSKRDVQVEERAIPNVGEVVRRTLTKDPLWESRPSRKVIS